MYNESETIDVGLFMADRSNESTLQWSYSARGTDADPVSFPISALLGASSDGFLEHRFDWTPDAVLYSNNNTNLTASSLRVERDDDHTIPSMPVPISFRHWSNGDPTSSEGPPRFTTQVARIRYARFFFNSSSPARAAEFSAQCAASAGAALCSTEDETLRGSSNFSQDALLAIAPYTEDRSAPKYSIIGISVSSGLILIFVIHGLVKNLIKRQSGQHSVVPTEEAMEEEPASPERASPPPFYRPGTSSPSSRDTHGSNRINDVEKDGVPPHSSSPHLSSSVQAKWDPIALARDQLDEDSDDSGDNDESDDDDDDDDDIMEDAQQEIDVTNDDGLGRPDRVQFAGHPHSVPDHAGELPRHNSVRRQNAARMSSYMSSYMTPARSSDPSLLLQQSEDDASVASAGYNGWSAANSRRGSAMMATAPSNGSMAPLNRLSQHASLTELHNRLLSGSEMDERKGSESSHEEMYDNRVPAFFKDYSMDGAPIYDGWNSKDSDTSHRKENRRPSFASLQTLSMLNNNFNGQYNDAAPPAISVWTRLDKAGDKEEQGDVLAARVEASSPIETPAKPWWKRAFEYMFVNADSGTMTASGAARVNYLEGLRGFACFLVSFNHFMLMFWYAATTAGAPTHTDGFEVWFYRILSPLLLNQGTKIGIFFVLPARVMGTRYMLRGKLQDVADSTLRRVPRLAFPTFGAVLINYFLIQVNAYKWVPRLASRTWSTWAYYQDYDSVGSFINAWISLWFTLPPDNPTLLSTYATGVLWTIPVITQSSFAILITVIISREMPNAYKRYGFYFFCIFLSWYANRFDYYFIAGLVIADMDNKLKYREAAARGIPLVPAKIGQQLPKFLRQGRVHGQVVGWILFLGGSMVQYLEFDHAPGGRFNSWEHGILPDLRTSLPRVWEGVRSENYNDPRFSLFAMVMGIFILCDLCKTFAGFFMLR